jgi:hypothetical protein
MRPLERNRCRWENKNKTTLRGAKYERVGSVCLTQRSPTDGPRENFGGSWRNLDFICNFYVYYTVSLYYDIISNKQQEISH